MNAAIGDKRRLRIAVLNRSFVSTGGGAERYSIALVEQLAQRHDIHVFAQEIQHQWPGVTYHRLWTLSSRPRWLNQLWFALTSWLATRRGFDVVHSHENTWHGQVQTVHVLPVKHNLFVNRDSFRLALRWAKVVTSPRLLAYLWLERMRYQPVHGRIIVATSPTLGEILKAAYPALAPNLAIIAPGVGDVPGLASVEARRDARHRLGLPVEGHCLLFVGNDYAKKGLPALMDALSLLPQDFFVAVVGNSRHIPGFQALAFARGLSKRIYFLGSLQQMELAYGAADSLVHPTLEDTFAMVVLEAMAHGLPVVVSGAQYCGISVLLRHGKDALLLNDPRDPAAIARAVERIFSDEALRGTMSMSGLAFAKSYLWSAIAEQQDDVYRRAMQLTAHA